MNFDPESPSYVNSLAKTVRAPGEPMNPSLKGSIANSKKNNSGGFSNVGRRPSFADMMSGSALAASKKILNGDQLSARTRDANKN